jgi:hypothetical protein
MPNVFPFRDERPYRATTVTPIMGEIYVKTEDDSHNLAPCKIIGAYFDPFAERVIAILMSPFSKHFIFKPMDELIIITDPSEMDRLREENAEKNR